jgi:hypothetical protein
MATPTSVTKSGKMPFDYAGFRDELRGHANGPGEVKMT